MKNIFAVLCIFSTSASFASEATLPLQIDLLPRSIKSWDLNLSPCMKAEITPLYGPQNGRKLEGLARRLVLSIEYATGKRKEFMVSAIGVPTGSTNTPQCEDLEGVVREMRVADIKKVLISIFESTTKQFYSSSSCACYGKHIQLVLHSVNYDIKFEDGLIIDSSSFYAVRTGKSYQQCQEGAIFE